MARARPLWLAAVVALMLLSGSVPAAVAGKPGIRQCGAGQASGTMPLPMAAGQAAVVEGYLDDQCRLVVSAVRFVDTASLAGAIPTVIDAVGVGGASDGVAALAGGVTDHWVTTRMWDCCGIKMTEAVLHLQYGWNGQTISSRFVQLSESHHREVAGGWFVKASHLGATAGCVGCASISYRGWVRFGYKGVFDPTGTVFENFHDNRLTGRGNGGWDCWWQITWKQSVPGWHHEAFCS